MSVDLGYLGHYLRHYLRCYLRCNLIDSLTQLLTDFLNNFEIQQRLNFDVFIMCFKTLKTLINLSSLRKVDCSNKFKCLIFCLKY